MKLVLVRHVETFGNVERRLNGHTESDYTARGEKMKDILVDHLLEIDQKIKFDTIFTSPISRAFKIAQAIGHATNKPVITDKRLREFNFGIFEGKTREEIIDTRPKEWEAWMDDRDDYQIPGGQSQGEFQIVLKSFLDELEDKSYLIVAHGGTIHSIMTNLMSLPINKKWHFDIKLGSITTLKVYDGFGMLSYMSTPPYKDLINDRVDFYESKIFIKE